MKTKESRDDFARMVVRHFLNPTSRTLEEGMAMVRDSYRTGALNRQERKALQQALLACDEFEALAARYGT